MRLQSRYMALLRTAIGFVAMFGAGSAYSQLSIQSVANSDYVSQGISQTLGEPTLQAGLSYGHTSGLYAGFWVAENSLYTHYQTNYRVKDNTIREIDYYAGWQTPTEKGGTWSATWSRYTFPDDPRYTDYRYDELVLSYETGNGITASLGVNDKFYKIDKHSVFAEASYEFAINRTLLLNAGYGYHDTEKIFDRDYRYWNVGITKLMGRVSFNLNYIDTDNNAVTIFSEDAAGDRWAFSVGLSIF